MNSAYVIQFSTALRRGDDDSALSMLENGRVTIRSVYFSGADGVRVSFPLIFTAVRFGREQVVRALVRLGANIDTFRVEVNGDSTTPACDAIRRSDTTALSICVSLCADLSCVLRTAGSPPIVKSGLEVAISGAKHAPLTFLLDSVYTTRPVSLSTNEVISLVNVSSCGSPAKIVFETLQSRLFDFKSLEGFACNPSDENPHATTLADILLAFAQKSGAADLVRYLVRDLGLVSTAIRLDSLKDSMDQEFAQPCGGGVFPPRADLGKYECAACEVVGATEFCSRCKVPRYCSKECQRIHWKTGGHKQECKQIQRRMRSKEEASKEGSSGAAGSSNS